MSEITIKEEYNIVDEPSLITMTVGGLVIGMVIFFILGELFKSWEYIVYLQYGQMFVVLLISYSAGKEVDTVIKFNTVTADIYTKNRKQFWEGKVDETSVFEVLTKEETDYRGVTITEYKLYVELSDKSFYEVPLRIEIVKELIMAVERVKGINN